MHTGMLWFDNSQLTLNAKIQKAMAYYHKKYGRTPDWFTRACLKRTNHIWK